MDIISATSDITVGTQETEPVRWVDVAPKWACTIHGPFWKAEGCLLRIMWPKQGTSEGKISDAQALTLDDDQQPPREVAFRTQYVNGERIQIQSGLELLAGDGISTRVGPFR